MTSTLQPASGAAISPLPPVNPSSPDPAIIAQTILRWQAPAVTAIEPSDRFTALHRLVKRIAQIRVASPTSEPDGDPADQVEGSEESGRTELPGADQPDSPFEKLLHQVRPEAQSVLDSLQAAPIEPTAPAMLQMAPLSRLTPWLLWNLMQISHEVVTLMEGCVAQVKGKSRSAAWQTGILRLVPVFRLQQPQRTYQFDLVTQRAAPSRVLAATTGVHLPDSVLAPQPTPIAAIRQRLIQQGQQQGRLQPYLNGLAADWLIPYHPWQSGIATIELEFEFVVNPAGSTPDSANQNLSTEAAQPLTPQDSPVQPDSLPFEQSSLKLAQPTWLEQHVSQAVEHQLTQVLQQVPLLSPGTQAELTLEQIVAQSCTAIEALQQSLTLASRILIQQSLTLEQLGSRLLWSVNRADYEVTQWMSGMAVNLLQPQSDWITGHLRFVLHLLVQLPDRTWQWDLMRRSVGMTLTSPASDSIVCAPESAWCLQPTGLGQLEQQLWQTITQQAPEIALLRSATDVMLTNATAAGQLGVMRLIGAFEFKPN